MNLSTLIMLLLIVWLVLLDIRYLTKKKASGCSGSCSGCTTCRFTEDLEKAKADIRKNKVA